MRFFLLALMTSLSWAAPTIQKTVSDSLKRFGDTTWVNGKIAGAKIDTALVKTLIGDTAAAHPDSALHGAIVKAIKDTAAAHPDSSLHGAITKAIKDTAAAHPDSALHGAINAAIALKAVKAHTDSMHIADSTLAASKQTAGTYYGPSDTSATLATKANLTPYALKSDTTHNDTVGHEAITKAIKDTAAAHPDSALHGAINAAIALKSNKTTTDSQHVADSTAAAGKQKPVIAGTGISIGVGAAKDTIRATGGAGGGYSSAAQIKDSLGFQPADSEQLAYDESIMVTAVLSNYFQSDAGPQYFGTYGPNQGQEPPIVLVPDQHPSTDMKRPFGVLIDSVGQPGKLCWSDKDAVVHCISGTNTGDTVGLGAINAAIGGKQASLGYTPAKALVGSGVTIHSSATNDTIIATASASSGYAYINVGDSNYTLTDTTAAVINYTNTLTASRTLTLPSVNTVHHPVDIIAPISVGIYQINITPAAGDSVYISNANYGTSPVVLNNGGASTRLIRIGTTNWRSVP